MGVLGLGALLLLAVAAQQDCTLPEVSNAAEDGVCGAAVLAAGETCEPQCAEGFAARGERAAIGLSLLARRRRGLTGLPTGGGAAGLLGPAGMDARVDELGALHLCCVRCCLQRQSLNSDHCCDRCRAWRREQQPGAELHGGGRAVSR
eukprot:COSAG02_NODE_1146_length_14225_cov_10.142989_1_plen_148_part_00